MDSNEDLEKLGKEDIDKLKDLQSTLEKLGVAQNLYMILQKNING